jgi:hypothetical protein
MRTAASGQVQLNAIQKLNVQSRGKAPRLVMRNAMIGPDDGIGGRAVNMHALGANRV